MVAEAGTRSELKASLFDVARGWPVAGFSYHLPEERKLIMVVDADSTWVHVISADLWSSTSIGRDKWEFLASLGQIKKADVPWRDVSELQRSLFYGS